MRSVEQMRVFVHEEASRRASRNQLALAAGACTVALLALVVVAVGVVRVEPFAERSSTEDPELTAAGPTEAPGSTTAHRAGSRPPAPPGPPAGSPGTSVGGATSGVGVGEGGRRPDPTTGRPPTTRPRVPAPGSPAPSTGPGDAAAADPGEVAPRATSVAPTSPSVGAPPPPGAVTTTTTTPSTTPTTTPPGGPRTCTDQDIASSDIVWLSGSTGEPFPDRAAPVGEATWFVVSVWSQGATTCLTRDGRQVLTVTDAAGAVVYEHLLDEGGGRLVEPRTWVLADGWFHWDPSCVEAGPGGWTTVTCTPTGAGSYTAQITVAGAVLPPVAITILDDRSAGPHPPERPTRP